MNYLVQRVTAIEMFPIRALILYIGGVDEYKNFANVESESSWSLRAITRPDDIGGQRVVGWRAEAKIYVPHAIFASFGATENATDIPLIRELKNLSLRDTVDAELILGDAPFFGVGISTAPTPYNYTGGGKIDFGHCSFSFEVESADLRGRSIITIGRTAKTVTMSVDDDNDYDDADTIFISHYSGG